MHQKECMSCEKNGTSELNKEKIKYTLEKRYALDTKIKFVASLVFVGVDREETFTLRELKFTEKDFEGIAVDEEDFKGVVVDEEEIESMISERYRKWIEKLVLSHSDWEVIKQSL